MVGGKYMIPEFSKVRISKTEYRWVVGTRVNGYDWCSTFGEAVRYWLWHCGVSPKIAFGWFKRKRHEQD